MEVPGPKTWARDTLDFLEKHREAGGVERNIEMRGRQTRKELKQVT